MLSAVLFIVSLGLGIIAPVLPLYAESFHVSYFAVGMVIAVFGGARVIVNLPTAYLSSKHGTRFVMILGAAIVGISSIICGGAQDFLQLFLGRLIMGIGTAMVYTPAMIYMADLAPVEQRGRFMSFYQGSILAGASAGPAVGGLIAGGYGFRAPFYAYAVTAFIGLLVIFMLKPVPSKSPMSIEKTPLRDSLGFLFNRNILLVNYAVFLSFFQRTGLQYTVLPPYLVGLQFDVVEIGNLMAVLAVMKLMLLVPVGWISDKMGRKTLTASGNILSGVVVLLFSMTGDYGLLILLAATWGVSAGVSGPLPAAMIVDMSGKRRNLALSMNRTIADLGFVLGPLVTGALLDAWGSQLPFYLTVIALISGGLGMQLFVKEPKKSSPS